MNRHETGLVAGNVERRSGCLGGGMGRGEVVRGERVRRGRLERA